MFSGVIYVSLLPLLPKNHNIDCCCLLSMFFFIVFEVVFNLISLRAEALSNKTNLSILSAFVCHQQYKPQFA